jgi:hypothetical protein
MRRELYVYYRVPAAHADRAAAQVHCLHAELARRFPQMTARLLQRAPQGDDDQTWMETYAITGDGDFPEGVDAALEAEIERLAAAQVTALAGPRHVEVFFA